MKRFLLLGMAFVPLGILRAQSESPRVSNFAPLDYFAENCARCHGPNGSFYGENFGKGLKDDTALKQVVHEMAEGPGNAPLEGADLETLTDFHRALRDGKPYLVAVSWKDGILSGEATPDAKVTLEAGEKTVEVELKEQKWSVTIGESWKNAKLRAVKDGKETVLEFSGFIR
ncbi:MAG TPA: hypothetical protein VGB45_00570 [Abditibacterium sp.]|jgi:hypothetical protein